MKPQQNEIMLINKHNRYKIDVSLEDTLGKPDEQTKTAP
jgi:hypothetical protein